MFKKVLLAATIVILGVSLLYSSAPHENSVREIERKKVDFKEVTGTELTKLQPSFKSILDRYEKHPRVMINPVNYSPHRVIGEPIELLPKENQTKSRILSELEDFIDSHKKLLNVGKTEVVFEECEVSGEKWFIRYKQEYKGIPVHNSNLEFRVFKGNLVLWGSDAKNIRGEIETTPDISEENATEVAHSSLGLVNTPVEDKHTGLKLVPVLKGESYELVLCHHLSVNPLESSENWHFFVNANTGEIIERRNQTRYYAFSGTVKGKVHEHYPDDPLVKKPYPYISLTLDDETGHTDSSGYFSFSGFSDTSYTANMDLSGSYANVNNEDGSDGVFTNFYDQSDSPAELVWTTSDAGESELNAYYHVNVAYEYIDKFLGYSGLGYTMRANVNVGDDMANAYFDGSSVNFGAGNSSTRNFALHAEIIYHEYTHAVTRSIYEGSLSYEGQSGAISEACSDYFACTMTGDPRVSEGIYTSGGAMRTLDNSNTYPEDFIDEVHHDGTIIGGAFWDIRSLLRTGKTDSLVHRARFGLPTNFNDYLYEMLYVDDDDGSLENGTPNAYAILHSFEAHGIGPGPDVSFTHTPHFDTEDTASAYTISSQITCPLGLEDDSLFVVYRVDSGAWNFSALAPGSSPDQYLAEIPAQSYTSHIEYFIKAISNAGSLYTYPSGGESAPFEFYVRADTLQPSITHSPLDDQSTVKWPTYLFARIEDNLGIKEARFIYKKNGVEKPPIEISLFEEPYIYSISLSFDVEIGDTIDYRIVAKDSSLAENVTQAPETGWYSFAVGSDYFEDFEDMFCRAYEAENVTSGYVNQWHLTETFNHTPGGTKSWKCGEEGARSEYANKLDAALITPTVHLSGSEKLKFYHFMNAEDSDDYADSAWDGGIVEIKRVGGARWTQIFPESGYPYHIIANPASPFSPGTPCFSGLERWTEKTFDLSGYSGDYAIRFRFGSDAYVAESGWFIDDITITDTTSFVLEDSTWRAQDKHFLSNSPNPFKRKTKISFSADKNYQNVTLNIYNFKGEKVKVYPFQDLNKGVYSVSWTGKNRVGKEVPAGIYLAQLKLNQKSYSTRILLMD